MFNLMLIDRTVTLSKILADGGFSPDEQALMVEASRGASPALRRRQRARMHMYQRFVEGTARGRGFASLFRGHTARDPELVATWLALWYFGLPAPPLPSPLHLRRPVVLGGNPCIPGDSFLIVNPPPPPLAPKWLLLHGFQGRVWFDIHARDSLVDAIVRLVGPTTCVRISLHDASTPADAAAPWEPLFPTNSPSADVREVDSIFDALKARLTPEGAEKRYTAFVTTAGEQTPPSLVPPQDDRRIVCISRSGIIGSDMAYLYLVHKYPREQDVPLAQYTEAFMVIARILTPGAGLRALARDVDGVAAHCLIGPASQVNANNGRQHSTRTYGGACFSCGMLAAVVRAARFTSRTGNPRITVNIEPLPEYSTVLRAAGTEIVVNLHIQPDIARGVHAVLRAATSPAEREHMVAVDVWTDGRFWDPSNTPTTGLVRFNITDGSRINDTAVRLPMLVLQQLDKERTAPPSLIAVRPVYRTYTAYWGKWYSVDKAARTARSFRFVLDEHVDSFRNKMAQLRGAAGGVGMVGSDCVVLSQEPADDNTRRGRSPFLLTSSTSQDDWLLFCSQLVSPVLWCTLGPAFTVNGPASQQEGQQSPWGLHTAYRNLMPSSFHLEEQDAKERQARLESRRLEQNPEQRPEKRGRHKHKRQDQTWNAQEAGLDPALARFGLSNMPSMPSLLGLGPGTSSNALLWDSSFPASHSRFFPSHGTVDKQCDVMPCTFPSCNDEFHLRGTSDIASLQKHMMEHAAAVLRGEHLNDTWSVYEYGQGGSLGELRADFESVLSSLHDADGSHSSSASSSSDSEAGQDEEPAPAPAPTRTARGPPRKRRRLRSFATDPTYWPGFSGGSSSSSDEDSAGDGSRESGGTSTTSRRRRAPATDPSYRPGRDGEPESTAYADDRDEELRQSAAPEWSWGQDPADADGKLRVLVREAKKKQASEKETAENKAANGDGEIVEKETEGAPAEVAKASATKGRSKAKPAARADKRRAAAVAAAEGGRQTEVRRSARIRQPSVK